MLRALDHRDYRLWAGADLFSTVGSWMQLVAQNWLVLQLTHSPAKLGVTLTVQALPTLAFGLWGGALADRVSRKRLVMCTQAAFAVLAGLLALATATGTITIWSLWALSFLTGAVSTLNTPAVANLCADIVPAADLGNAIALGAMTSSTGRILGMACAGTVVASVGAAAAFAINAVSFLAVLGAVAAMRPRAATARRRVASEGAIAGFRHIRRSPELLGLFGLCFVLSTFGRNFQVTMAAMVVGPFHAGANAYGLLSTVFAVGTLVGAMIAARCTRLDSRLLVRAAAVAAILQVLSGFSPDVGVFGALMCPIAMAAVLVDTVAGYLAQTHGDPAFRGRVVAAAGLVSAAAGAVGGPLLGVLTEWTGARGALGLGGAVALAATLCSAAGKQRRASRPDVVAAQVVGVLVG